MSLTPASKIDYAVASNNLRYVRRVVYGMSRSEVTDRLRLGKNTWAHYESPLHPSFPKSDLLMAFCRLTEAMAVPAGLIIFHDCHAIGRDALIKCALFMETVMRMEESEIAVWAPHAWHSFKYEVLLGGEAGMLEDMKWRELQVSRLRPKPFDGEG